MRRLVWVVAVFLALLVGSHVSADPPGTADLRIALDSTVGPAEFQTLGLPVAVFTLGDGEVRAFRKLDAGTYTVVQAPPVDGRISVRCSNGDFADNVTLSGQDVTCTFELTATP